MAPGTWGNVSNEIHAKYICKMEDKWPMLRYCENNWKADALATSIYSQWYHGPRKRVNGPKDANQGCDESIAKKRRATTKATYNMPKPSSQVQDDSEIASTPTGKTPFEDEDIAGSPSPQVEEQGPTQPPTSKPTARPLRNPL